MRKGDRDPEGPDLPSQKVADQFSDLLPGMQLPIADLEDPLALFLRKMEAGSGKSPRATHLNRERKAVSRGP
jgi:hypothetical protein